MTDLATRHDADETDSGDGGSAQEYAWAPAEPAPRRSRAALWIGIPAAATVVALVAASLILIAPGTTVAGVGVGGLTAGSASEAVAARLAETTVVVEGPDGAYELTGADLGATVDAPALAEQAFAEHPMWNVTGWYSDGVPGTVQVDTDAVIAALAAAAPEHYVAPVDAEVVFDEATATYTVTPAVDGEGVDPAVVVGALQDAFDRGQTTTTVQVDVAPIDAPVTTAAAQGTVDTLNGMLDVVGFYIGDERTVPVDRAVAASWLEITANDADGAFEIVADADAIQTAVDGLAAAVDRAPVDATVITNTAGDPLPNPVEGQVGRAVDDLDVIADAFAEQLAAGDATYDLTVSETAFQTTYLARSVEVNLSTQTAYLFENDQVIGTYTISSGTSATPTPAGRFTVTGYSRQQNMGCFDGAPYCVEDVPWVTWFAPDIGFHGANALRSSLGYPQSHGCVNMWDDAAKLVYDWTRMGTEVWVHY